MWGRVSDPSMSGATRRTTMNSDSETLTRCSWPSNDLSIRYHDEEWGTPAHDDVTLFEFLILEGAQAGLSWDTILKKRENYRAAFNNFDPVRLQALNYRGPVAKARDAGKEKVASAGKEIAGHGEHEKVAGCGPVALRPEQYDPEDRREKQIDQRAIGRDPARVNVRLQGDRAHGDLMCSA